MDVDPDLMKVRIANLDGQKVEKAAYQKFRILINGTSERDEHAVQNKKILMQTAQMFYDLGEPTLRWGEIELGLNPLDLANLKKAVLELSLEAINRDMIEYIRTGTRGNFAARLYKNMHGRLL
jgi:hypothetical protein